MRVSKGNARWWYLVWVAVALAVMVKSVAGLVGIIAIGLTVTLNREIEKTVTSPHFQLGFLIALLIVAPWHLYMYGLYGEQFLDMYLGKHVIQRTVSVLEGHRGTPSHYLNQLREQYFPWCYLAPFALAYGLKREGIETQCQKILWALVIVVFGVTTLVQTKLPWYIIPVYPALAILIAFTVRQAVRSRRSIAFGGLVVTSLITSLMASMAIVQLFVGLAVGLIAFCWKVRKDAWKPAAIVMTAFLVSVGMSKILPLYEQEQSPIARLAKTAASTGPHDQEPLIVFSNIGARRQHSIANHDCRWRRRCCMIQLRREWGR